MESLRKLGLLDADGKPLEDRLSKVLNALLPRFRRRFPAIQDDVEVTEVFEEAARRITKRERASGPIEKLGGYAWKALESIGVSTQRRGSMQIRFNSVESRTGPEIVSRLRAWDGSVEEIERGILLRELEAHMTAEEASDLPAEGPRLLERGDREAPRQLGELGRQGHEPLEAENSCADRGEGVENTGRAQVVPRHSPLSSLATSSDTEIADDERRSAP